MSFNFYIDWHMIEAKLKSSKDTCGVSWSWSVVTHMSRMADKVHEANKHYVNKQ